VRDLFRCTRTGVTAEAGSAPVSNQNRIRAHFSPCGVLETSCSQSQAKCAPARCVVEGITYGSSSNLIKWHRAASATLLLNNMMCCCMLLSRRKMIQPQCCVCVTIRIGPSTGRSSVVPVRPSDASFWEVSEHGSGASALVSPSRERVSQAHRVGYEMASRAPVSSVAPGRFPYRCFRFA